MNDECESHDSHNSEASKRRLGWRPLGAKPLSAVVGIPLTAKPGPEGAVGRWLRRAKTPTRVAGARWSITVRGATLLACENLRQADVDFRLEM